MSRAAETPDGARVPTPEEILALGHVPLLASFFRRVHNDMPEPLREVFAEHGLTARHGAVLTQLVAAQPASVSQLAQRLHVSLSTASGLVGDLSRAGLVTRHEDPGNRRRTLVSMPQRHRPLFEEFVAARAAPLLRAMDRLSPRDRAGFVAGLTEWAREVEGQDDDGPDC
ncbi:MarR family winged helix-turn-helix transcriptional regulator [Actinomadura sp. SCN-SB]|uniref:MarR family winged helix-turn-helix transcriptional regulator n=1 Tax=Actinomadura sp. SCN-SB TaxID=3373092 RepID=UPI00375241CC